MDAGRVETASSAVLTDNSLPSSGVTNTRRCGPENSEFLTCSILPSSPASGRSSRREQAPAIRTRAMPRRIAVGLMVTFHRP